ncbi:MAG: hypothetical protein H8D56_15015 [Planctomycetes bacterium]|nr:hypothetical protein [Planctomycetota bacterium]MBL7143295.1 hypothetical protein [Phycisphaerae bacterium]
MGEKRTFTCMLRRIICLILLVLLGSWAAEPVRSASIHIENASFEDPVVDPNGFPALPFVDQWTEIDLDSLSSSNTGVFGNTPAGNPDHIVNADGNQLAFLGSESGNALEQDLADTYKSGRDYRLTVAVGISSLFPPSSIEPVDSLELALFYRDGNDVVDIVSKTVEATGLSSTQLTDFSLHLPKVKSGDAWADKAIGIALRSAGMPGGFWDLDNVRLNESLPVSIPIENASFEAPFVDPNAFPALPFVEAWIETDNDTLGSTNTGVFANTPGGKTDHIVNPDGNQLVFLGSELGNGLEQDLNANYIAGCDYRLTVAVGISSRFPPSTAELMDTLELVLFYRDGNDVLVDIARQTVDAVGLYPQQLVDFSLHLPTVQSSDSWAGKAIGVALRAAGMPGGFWDLDNVRLIESLPVSIPIENASFEAPFVDPNAFPALPFVEAWTETDNDTQGSTNTGVFANTPGGKTDHIVNPDGRQLVFLGSELGNGIEQDVRANYIAGCDYRLTVAVGISSRFPPSTVEPVDTVELVLFYRDESNVMVDIVHQTVDAVGLYPQQLVDFSLHLPTVQSSDAWAGKAIGVALRAVGMPGGFWDLDQVRLAESLPEPISDSAE